MAPFHSLETSTSCDEDFQAVHALRSSSCSPVAKADALDVDLIRVKVAPGPTSLRSAFRNGGRRQRCESCMAASVVRPAQLEGSLLLHTHVRWASSTQEATETLSARRDAFRRLREACTAVPACGLAQTEESIRRCMLEADLLPAANLERLRALLYALPAAAWYPTKYPVVFDVAGILTAVGNLQSMYRWWHVRLNFAISYLPRISLREVLQKLIELHGSDAACAGFHYPDKHQFHSPYPTVLFLPAEPASLCSQEEEDDPPPFAPPRALKRDRSRSEELRSLSSTAAGDSDCEDFRTEEEEDDEDGARPDASALRIHKIEISRIDEWCQVLRILRDNNAWSKVLVTLVNEGLALLEAEGFLLEEEDPPCWQPATPPNVQRAY